MMATEDVDRVEHSVKVTEEDDVEEAEKCGEAAVDEDEILNEYAEGDECIEVHETGEEGQHSNMDVNDPRQKMVHKERKEMVEAEGARAEHKLIDEDGNADIEETGEETELVTEDAEHSTSIHEDEASVDNVQDEPNRDSAENEAHADNTKDGDNVSNTKGGDNASDVEDEDNAMGPGNGEDLDEDAALTLRDFKVLDEAPGDDLV